MWGSSKQHHLQWWRKTKPLRKTWCCGGRAGRRGAESGGCGGGLLDHTRAPFSSHQTLSVAEISAKMLVNGRDQLTVAVCQWFRDEPWGISPCRKKKKEKKEEKKPKKTKNPCWLQEAASSNTNTLRKEQRGAKLKLSESRANDKQLQLFQTASGSCCTFCAVDEIIQPQQAFQ